MLDKLLQEVAARKEKSEALDEARRDLAVYILNSLGPSETRRLANSLKWRALAQEYWPL